MAVKYKKIIQFENGLREVVSYLPADYIVTKEAKESADRIDEILRIEIEKINNDFLSVNDTVKKDSLLKWKWLSERLKKIVDLLKKNDLKEKDVTDNHIWVPVGQYLCDELSSGVNTRRAGTHKDHYRKVYLLSEIKGVDWINSWSGWDAFADRGDGILQYPEIFSELEKRFGDMAGSLTSRDHQFIAKKLVEYIPMSGNEKKSVSSLSSDELSSVAKRVFTDYKHRV